MDAILDAITPLGVSYSLVLLGCLLDELVFELILKVNPFHQLLHRLVILLNLLQRGAKLLLNFGVLWVLIFKLEYVLVSLVSLLVCQLLGL